MCIADLTANDLPLTTDLRIREGRAIAANLRATASECAQSSPAIAKRFTQAAEMIDGLVQLLEPKR